MRLGVSTGVLHGTVSGLNERIDFFRNSGIALDGVEISFARPSDMADCVSISDANVSYLRGLSFCTLHLPWKDVLYDGRSDAFLPVLAGLYRDAGCGLAVVHPDCVVDIDAYGQLLDCFSSVAVENMTPDRNFGAFVGDLEQVVSAVPRIGVVVDYAHCMAGGDSFADFETRFSSRVREIHMSAYSDCGGLSKHVLLSSGSVRPAIRLKNVPVVLEGPTGSVDELRKEIDFVRGLND